MKKHLNLNTVLLLLLGALGGFVQYDVDKIRKATDQVAVLATQLIDLQKDVEEMKRELKEHDRRIRMTETQKAKQP